LKEAAALTPQYGVADEAGAWEEEPWCAALSPCRLVAGIALRDLLDHAKDLLVGAIVLLASIG
jgi:hypothetical protein